MAIFFPPWALEVLPFISFFILILFFLCLVLSALLLFVVNPILQTEGVGGAPLPASLVFSH